LPKEISEGRKGVLKECAERMRLFLFLRGYYSDKIIPCISSSSKTHAFVHCPIRPSDHPSYHRSTERMEKQESRRGMPAASKYPNSRSCDRATCRSSTRLALRYVASASTAGIPILLAGPSLYGKIIPSLFPAKSSCQARLRRGFLRLHGERSCAAPRNRKFNSRRHVARPRAFSHVQHATGNRNWGSCSSGDGQGNHVAGWKTAGRKREARNAR